MKRNVLHQGVFGNAARVRGSRGEGVLVSIVER